MVSEARENPQTPARDLTCVRVCLHGTERKQVCCGQIKVARVENTALTRAVALGKILLMNHIETQRCLSSLITMLEFLFPPFFFSLGGDRYFISLKWGRGELLPPVPRGATVRGRG